MKDVHMHVFSEAVKENPEKMFDDKNFKMLYFPENRKICGYDDCISYLEESDTENAFLLSFSWSLKKYVDFENQYLSTLKKSEKAKIFGMISREENNIGLELIKLKNLGFAGIGEVAFYDGNVDYFFLNELFKECAVHEMPVILHVNDPVGHDYCGKYKTSFSKLYEIISKNPETMIILSHMGGGIFIWEMMPEVKKAFRNVYYDTAAVPYLYDSDLFKKAINIVPEKILFGSDYPLIYKNTYEKKFDMELLKKLAESTDSFFNKIF